MVNKIVIVGFAFAVGLQCSLADTTTVSFDSGSQTMFNQASIALSGGTINDGDGDVLQLGYYTGANFTGNWVPLSGETSLNTAIIAGSSPAEPYNKTSIGDLNSNGAGNGTFAMSLDFVAGSATSGNSLPSNGTQLALRFYNGTTLASSTFYNAVTDPLWTWKTPATPPAVVTMSFDDAGLVWQGGVNSAFHTTISFSQVPEPSVIASLLVGAAILGSRAIRRRH
jgi:hypothetical protein